MKTLGESSSDLSASLLFMEQLFDEERYALAAYDGDLRFVMWSPAMEALTRRPAARVVGKEAHGVFPTIRVTGDDQKMQQALQGLYATTRDSAPFGVTDNTIPRVDMFYAPLGGPLGVVGGLIAAREQGQGTRIQEQLQEAEARFRTMANCAPVLLWMSNTTALCTFFNQTWLDFTGRALEEEAGYGWATGVHPEDFETCVNTYMKAFSRREGFRMIYRLRRHDGAYRWILDSGAPRYTPAGRFAGFIGSCVDITDQKLVEQSLEETAANLRAARDQMETLLHAASHDLREPLRMVANYTALIERKYGDSLDEDGRRYVRYSVDGARRMRGLIDGLLSFASAREIERTRFEVVPLREALDIALSNIELMVQESNAEVAVGDLSAVQGVTQHLVHLFQNLLANAVKFRSDQAPRVDVWAERLGDEWLVHVKDNGIGMPQEYAEKAFALLSRLHRHDEYPGSGIGLALCREIVRRHGGRITLSSVPGRGTTVSFTLPLSNEAIGGSASGQKDSGFESPGRAVDP